MPKKDGAMDDNKKTTKDVVNKKQKQMLNQEEIDPAKIAEAFGGYVVEAKKDGDEKIGGRKYTKAERDKIEAQLRGKQKISTQNVNIPANTQQGREFMDKLNRLAQKTKSTPDAPSTQLKGETKETMSRKGASSVVKNPSLFADKEGNVPPKPGRSATRRKPKVSFQDVKKQIDAKNPTYVSPKSGGRLPVRKSRKPKVDPTTPLQNRPPKSRRTSDSSDGYKELTQRMKDLAKQDVTDKKVIDRVKQVGRRTARRKAAIGATARTIAKQLPVVGLPFAAGEIAARMGKGDKRGAAYQTASTLARQIPIVGPAIGAAADVAIGARDVAQAPKTAEIDDKVNKLVKKKVKRIDDFVPGAKGKKGKLPNVDAPRLEKDLKKKLKVQFPAQQGFATELPKKMRGKMMGKTVGGLGLRAGGVTALGMGAMNMFKRPPRVKGETGVVGKRSAGG